MEENFISLLKIKDLLYLSVCDSRMEIMLWGANNEDRQPLETREER